MNLRSVVVWCVFVVLAILNGALRNTVLTPQLGQFAGHIASTVILCAAILIVTWLTISWVRPVNSSEALLIGGGWVLMTVAFEFLVGHYVFRSAWTTLLADYDLFAGRVWVLVLVTTALAPLLMARSRDAFTLPR
jgi:hypothetical protein